MARQWWMAVSLTLSTLMTIGTMPTTRLSTAPTSQVVQPRLEPPATTKPSIFSLPSESLAMNSCTAVIAAVPLFTIGRRSSWSGSRVLA
jgi:hypothetical protein